MECTLRGVENQSSLAVTPYVVVHGALLRGLHIALDVGGFMVERFVVEMEKCRESSKGLNVVLLMRYSYNFDLIQAGFMVDFIKVLIQRFEMEDIERIAMILQHTGYQLLVDIQKSGMDKYWWNGYTIVNVIRGWWVVEWIICCIILKRYPRKRKGRERMVQW